MFLRPWDQKRGRQRAEQAENEQQPWGDYKNGIRVLSSGNHRRRKRPHINNPPRSDPRRPARRLRRSFARLQAQVDHRARAKRTWGLLQSSAATCGALYLGGNPARSWAPLSGYQQDSYWSGRAQKAEVHARRPHLRPKLCGPLRIWTCPTVMMPDLKARWDFTHRLRRLETITGTWPRSDPASKRNGTSEPRCTRNTGAGLTLQTDDTVLTAASVGLAASGIGLLSTIIVVPVAVGLQAGAIVCGLLGAGGKFIGRRLGVKARKHDQTKQAKLNRRQDLGRADRR